MLHIALAKGGTITLESKWVGSHDVHVMLLFTKAKDSTSTYATSMNLEITRIEQFERPCVVSLSQASIPVQLGKACYIQLPQGANNLVLNGSLPKDSVVMMFTNVKDSKFAAQGGLISSAPYDLNPQDYLTLRSILDSFVDPTTGGPREIEYMVRPFDFAEVVPTSGSLNVVVGYTS